MCILFLCGFGGNPVPVLSSNKQTDRTNPSLSGLGAAKPVPVDEHDVGWGGNRLTKNLGTDFRSFSNHFRKVVSEHYARMSDLPRFIAVAECVC